MNKVELISVESVSWPDGKLGQPAPAPSWKVTLGVPQLYGGYVLQATFYLEKSSWKDDAVVPMAKSWLHNLNAGVAGSTADWNLTEQQIIALQKSPPKSPS